MCFSVEDIKTLMSMTCERMHDVERLKPLNRVEERQFNEMYMQYETLYFKLKRIIDGREDKVFNITIG